MQRPPDVTNEDMARWWLQAEKSGDPTPPALKKLFPQYQQSDYRERWCAAEWLARELDELGCDPELSSRICFANGQISFHVEDPWPVAQRAVDNFRVGKWEVPGPELAQRLFEEHFPRLVQQFGPPDIRVLRELIQSPEFKEPLAHPFPHDPV